jgi:hypothetical protein
MLFTVGKIYSAILRFRSKTASRFQINYIPSIGWPTTTRPQEMGQLRVAEIEANAQLIWGTWCPAFPD